MQPGPAGTAARAYQCWGEYLYKLVATRGVEAPDTRAAFMPGRRTQRNEDMLAFSLDTSGVLYPGPCRRGESGMSCRRPVVVSVAMPASLRARA